MVFLAYDTVATVTYSVAMIVASVDKEWVKQSTKKCWKLF